MPIPSYDDIDGSLLLPQLPVDPSTLRYPWDPEPAAAPPSAAGATPDPAASSPPIAPSPSPPAAAQPGLGIPAAALDAAVPPPIGPPTEAQAPAPGPNELLPQLPAGEPLPPIPFGARPNDASQPPPPVPPVAVTPVDALHPFGPPSESEQHYRQTTSDYATHPLDIPDAAEQQRYLSDLSTGQLADLTLRHDLDRERYINEQHRKIADADAEAQRRNFEDRQQAFKVAQAKSDALVADATRIAATKIDPAGGVHGARLVAGVIGSIIGGLVQGRTGSARNAGLDALNETINQGIEAQKADLANQREGLGFRRNLLAEEYARTGDMYEAEERVRLAALKHAEDMLATNAQNWDPRGTTALKSEALRRQVIGQQQALRDAHNQRSFENDLKDRNARREERLAANTVLHDRQQIGLGYAQLDSAAKDRAAAKEARAADKEAARADKEAETRRELSIGTLPRLKVDEKGAPVLDANGAPITETGELTQKDGKTPFLSPDKETRKTLADKTLAAAEINDIINEVLDIRDRVGGESSTFNSDESQRLKVLQNRLVILAKSGTQGMSSDEDMNKISAALGADNVASFRAQAAGLEKGRDRTTSELNNAYRIAKYTGPKIEFPNKWVKGPKNTAEEERKQALLEKPSVSFDDAAHAEISKRQRELTPEQRRDPDVYNATIRDGLAEARAMWHPDASPDQQREIVRLGGLAGGDSKEAASARKLLGEVAAGAHTARLRELAQGALTDAVDASVQSGGEPELVR